jgi:hypothetical protein
MGKPTDKKLKKSSKGSRSRGVSIDHLEKINFRTLAADVADLGDWLVEPLIPAHRSTAIVAEGGVGKSLIMLEVAAALATGQAIFHRPAGPPINVVYVDMEMTGSDLAERLESLGYDFTSDELLAEHLHYYQLQDFEPFDTHRGGDQLLHVARNDKAERDSWLSSGALCGGAM